MARLVAVNAYAPTSLLLQVKAASPGWPDVPKSHWNGPPCGAGRLPLSASIGFSGQMPVSRSANLTPLPASVLPPRIGPSCVAPTESGGARAVGFLAESY